MEGNTTANVPIDKKPEKEVKPIMTNCTMCRGEINIHSYRTYYTKTGIYCKPCVEKLPTDE